MKFILTIYLCSVFTGECVMPKQESFKYDTVYDTHYNCVRSGLGDSFELLFARDFFTEEAINQYQIYPKFTCEVVGVPKAKPAPDAQKPA